MGVTFIMLCILKFATPEPIESNVGEFFPALLEHTPGDEISGWILATDIGHAIAQTYDQELVQCLRQSSEKPGKYRLKSGHILLVS